MSYIERIARNYSSEVLSREELAYYARHILLPGIGLYGQKKLMAARVLVVGAGGLGCPALQALAGAGVGRLTVVDGDSVDISNLSRQWLHRYGDAGQNKASSACKTLRELNPFITVEAVPHMLTHSNARDLVEAHDVVVDATDDLEARYWIDDVCAELNRPWVHAALYRERSQLTVFWACSGADFRKLYPEPSEAPSCSGAGMLGGSASVVGNLQALEAIKLITGQSKPCVGKLVSLDAAGLTLQSFRLPDVAQPSVIPDAVNIPASQVIRVDALQQALSIHQPWCLLDIRSRRQYESGAIPGAQHCSAEQILESGLPELPAERTVLYCEEGTISRLLVEALCERHDSELVHLEGGYQAWQEGQ